MLKFTEQNNKLKRATILSLALHCVLIAILIWSSIYQLQESSTVIDRPFIDAVMVDSGAVVQQYNRQQQANAQRIQQQSDKQAHQQAEKLQQKQTTEQRRLKALGKQRVTTQETTEADPVKQHAEAQAKKVVAANAKAKADQATKDKAGAPKKVAAQAIKQSSDVDAFLGGLVEARSAPKDSVMSAKVGKAKQSGASGAEIDAYKTQVSRAISDKFYDSSSYSGRTCDLRIKLAPDGLLISVTAIGGDPVLCKAAVSAAKLATIPRPPSLQVYEVFKKATLGFSPQ